MKKLSFVLALLVPLGAMAQGFVDPGPTCYEWSGGHKSAGAFSRCNPELQPAAKKVAPLPPPVQPSPVMMPMSAPVTCAPPPKPVLHKAKPRPKKQC